MSAMIQIFIIIPQEKDVRRLKIVSILGVEWLNVKGKVDQQEQYDYQSQQLSPPAPCCGGWRWPRPWSAREGTRFRGSWGWRVVVVVMVKSYKLLNVMVVISNNKVSNNKQGQEPDSVGPEEYSGDDHEDHGGDM